jgi:hypothetical protein
MEAVDKLTAATAAVRAQANRTSSSSALLEAKVRTLAATLDAIVRGFPTVFAMPYSDLGDRVLAENSAIELAKRAAEGRNLSEMVSALEQAAGHEQTIGHAPRKQVACRAAGC